MTYLARKKRSSGGYLTVNLGWAIECCALCSRNVKLKYCYEICCEISFYDEVLICSYKTLSFWNVTVLGSLRATPKYRIEFFRLLELHILCENQHSEPRTTISFGASHWASGHVGHVGHTGQWHLTSYSAAGPLWNLPAICARFSKSVRYPHVSHSHWY